MLDNPFNVLLSGLEIKDWVWYNATNKTKYTALAKTMKAYFNIDNEKKYILTLDGTIPQIEEVSDWEG